MAKSLLIAVAAVAALVLSAPLQAQKQADPPKQEPEKTEQQKAADKAAEEQKKKVDEYEKAVKDLTRAQGPFTFYTRKRDVLLELPEADLGRLFLIQAAFGTGSSTNGTQAGDPVGDTAVDAFRFQREEDQVWLVRPNTSYRWSPEDPLGIASQRSFPEAILASFRIEQQHPVKKLLLINLTQLFYGDVFRLNELVNSGVGGQFMLDREKCMPDAIKGYPENSIVRMRLHFTSPRGAERNPLLALLGLGGGEHLADGRSLPISVSYTIWFRKDTGYRPRLADPRVGYFTEDFYSLDHFLSRDRTERYVMRFDVRKKDPTAPVSEPVKPIVWYLDTSIPPAYRDACREGLLRWGKAFEALGYKNAIVVKDAPNDPDWDHADGRFNVLRWTMSPGDAYAVSLVRTDPFTGEILNVGITLDANMLSFAQQEHQQVAIPAADRLDRAMKVLLRDPERKETDDSFLWTPREEQETAQALAGWRERGWRRLDCRYAVGLRESVSMGWNALEAHPGGLPISREAYARAFISDVVCHEAGHCLGLRHNFEGSTALTTAQLGDDAVTGAQGVSASVMDYVPVNVVAILKGKGNFFGPTVGPYDMWAIRYGYMDVKAYSPVGERYELDQIASRSRQPGLGYMTDENADTWNPFAVRFDNAKDPLAYSIKRLEAAARVQAYAIQKLPAPGESLAKRTGMILQSINAVFREGRLSVRFVGGVVATRSFGGKNSLVPVDARTQREALRLVAGKCLGENAVRLPADVRKNLALDSNLEDSIDWIAPLRMIVARQQAILFATLMSASTVDRISENALKSGPKDAYRLDEHVGTLVAAVFSELGRGVSVEPTRRDLQRFAVNALISQAGAPAGAVNEDMRLLATDSLRTLSKRIGTQLAKSVALDRITRLHLRDSKETIDRFLERRFAVGK